MISPFGRRLMPVSGVVPRERRCGLTRNIARECNEPMQVQVTGKQLDVGDALRARITDDLITSIGKYFERGGDADVVVSQDGHDFRVDCRVLLASGQYLESHGSGGDAHSAFDVALEKIQAR